MKEIFVNYRCLVNISSSDEAKKAALETYHKGPPFQNSILDEIKDEIFKNVLSAPALRHKIHFFSQACMYSNRIHGGQSDFPDELFDDLMEIAQDKYWQQPFYNKKGCAVAR